MLASWDTIVIGSGSGGLTAAVALARAGLHVLVLEQHHVPGGGCRSLSVEGYRFSPGVHSLGGLGPGGRLRALYEGLDLSDDLEFCEMNPEGFDHILASGQRFDVPRGFTRYFARLCARFPHEREALERYFTTLHRVDEALHRCRERPSLPAVPALLAWGFRAQGALFDRRFRDPLLRTILAARSGDHGLAPSRVSLPLHAGTIAHDDDGAFYPRGGAERIPLALIKALRRRGGQIRLHARVRQILVKRRKVLGVELASGERILAPSVISNADPAVTFDELLRPRHCDGERQRARCAESLLCPISVFCAVEMDLRRLGYDSGNYWWHRHRDVDAIGEALPSAQVDGLLLSITTLKDPGHRRDGRHTLEMLTFVPCVPFMRWKGTTPSGPESEQFKESLGDTLVAAAEQVIPGLRRAMVFRSVSSPLSDDGPYAGPSACSYGTTKTPQQLGLLSIAMESSVAGLYCCGASALHHGVAREAMNGLLAAKRVLHADRAEDLLGPADGSLRVYPSEEPETWLRGAPSLTPPPSTHHGYASRGADRVAAPRRG